MTQYKFSLGALAAATAVAATPTVADITPDDVWNSWQSYFTSLTLEVSATETRSGDDLLLKNMIISFEVPDEDADIAITLPDLDLIGQNDGTVSMVYAPDANFLINVTEDGETTFETTLDLSHSGMSIVASGDPDDITYLYVAAELDYRLGDITVDGEPLDPAMASVEGEITMSGVKGLINVTTDDVVRIKQDASYDRVAYDIRVVAPEEEGSFVTTAEIFDLATASDISIPSDIDFDDPYSIFNKDLKIELTASQGASETQTSGSDSGEAFSSQSSASGGSVDLFFDQEEFAMSFDSFDNVFTFFGGGVPLPISGEVGEMSMGLNMPLNASTTPQDFGMDFNMIDVMIPDLLWNIMDPGAVLERAPATISLGLEGTSRLFFDAFDPAFPQNDDFPGELNSLSLTDLRVEVAGAELTGRGDFTFDNSDMETFDGFPRPIGAADFRLLGGNTLLDSLIDMGLVSDSDAMGARMMMSLFTVAGPGDDELNSRLEVNDAGQILANGQRLR